MKDLPEPILFRCRFHFSLFPSVCRDRYTMGVNRRHANRNEALREFHEFARINEIRVMPNSYRIGKSHFEFQDPFSPPKLNVVEV